MYLNASNKTFQSFQTVLTQYLLQDFACYIKKTVGKISEGGHNKKLNITIYKDYPSVSTCWPDNINKRYMYGPSMDIILYFNEDSLFLCSLFFGKQAGLLELGGDTFKQSPKTEQQIQMLNTGILLPAPFWGVQCYVNDQTFNTDEIGEVQTSVEWGLLEEFYSILHI